MVNLRSLWLLLLTISLAGMTSRAHAQRPVKLWKADNTLEDKLKRSHRLDPDKFGLRGANPGELFRKALNKIRTKEVMENYKNNIQGQTPTKLSDFIQQNPQRIEEYLKSFKVEHLPPDLKKKLIGQDAAEFERFIQGMKPEDLGKYMKEAEGIDPPSEPSSQGDTPAQSPAPPDEPAPLSGDESTMQPGSSEVDAEEQMANSALGRWLLKAARRLDKMDPALRDSPALRKAIRELSRKIDGADERWKRLNLGANKFDEKLARLGQALPLDRLWPRNLTPASLPKWNLPKSVAYPRPRQEVGTLAVSEGDGWRVLLAFAAPVFAGIILWRLLARSRAASLPGVTVAWRLGPWPVHPAAVQTREDLIRAFEYLSVLCLGPVARHWHHRAIASGLGGLPDAARPVSPRGNTPLPWGEISVNRRLAADQLAALYERARYAPLAEPLPDSAMATARRDLCLLAGVPIS